MKLKLLPKSSVSKIPKPHNTKTANIGRFSYTQAQKLHHFAFHTVKKHPCGAIFIPKRIQRHHGGDRVAFGGVIKLTNGSVWDAVNKLCEAFGGHIVCDGMNVAINSSIDRDNGVVVRYGKNLRDISVEENWDNVVTVLYPIGKDGLMPGAVTANTPQRASYPIPYTKYVEFRQDISRSDYDSDEAYLSALTADLRAQAQEYVNVHQFPEVTYTVGAALEKLSDVGERVVVIDERMGLTLDTRVISYDYNCLIGKVTETKFGTLPPKLSAVMSQINSLSSRVNAIGG